MTYELLELPVDNDGKVPGIDLSIKMAGKSYVFLFRWSELAGAWAFDLETEAGEPILQGRLVTLQRNLLAGAVHPDRPPGMLFAARSTISVELPSLEGFGDSVRLYHAFAV